MDQSLRIARIIHLALFSGPAMATAVFYFLRQQEALSGQEPIESQPLLVYVAIAVALLAPVVSHFVATQLGRTAAARVSGDLSMTEVQVAGLYQTVKIVQWAIIEGGALLQAVIYFLSGEMTLLALAGLLLAFLAISGPSLADLQKRLEISDSRLRQIQAASQ